FFFFFFFLQEDLEILCKLEFSSPTYPLQLDAGAFSSSTGLYPSDNTPTVTLLIKSPALLRGFCLITYSGISQRP
ncbi:hypothetical protein Nmel_014493, partial [Mimus melanotis]